MKQLSFFKDVEINDIRKDVMAQFPRLPEEPYEEWREFIRVEVNERLKATITHKPDYTPYNLKKTADFENVLNELKPVRGLYQI